MSGSSSTTSTGLVSVSITTVKVGQGPLECTSRLALTGRRQPPYPRGKRARARRRRSPSAMPRAAITGVNGICVEPSPPTVVQLQLPVLPGFPPPPPAPSPLELDAPVLL